MPIPLRSAACILLAFVSAHAQLDLGSGGVPQDQIDAYMGPFYRVISAGAGSGRFTPREPGLGFDAGFQAGLAPLPDRDPFKNADLSAIPFLRGRAGARVGNSAFGAGEAMLRGSSWTDPRVGDLAAYGAGLAYAHDVPALPFPLSAALMGGWDRFLFSSTYTYKYRGSALGLFDQDIPGDYSLNEQVWAAGLMLSARLGTWTPYAQGWFEWTSGRFAYLYLDPRDDQTHRVHSDLSFPSGRGALGLLWRGFHVEASLGLNFAAEAGWSFIY